MTSKLESSRASAQRKKIRVLSVDDHPLIHRGLQELLASEGDLELIGTVGNAAEALRAARQYKPELVILDISLQDRNGLEIIKQLKACDESIKILALSMHDEKLYAERAIQAGALGYLNKQHAAEKIIEAIRIVLKGKIYLSAEMTERMMQFMFNGKDACSQSAVDGLSDRELEVFELIGRGTSVKEIAAQLHLSPKTIETYRENIKGKLQLHNSVELIQRATQWVLEQ